METGWEELSAETGAGGSMQSHSRNPTAAKAGCPTGQHRTIAGEKMRKSRVAGHWDLFYSMSGRIPTSAKQSNDSAINSDGILPVVGKS